MSRQRIIVTDTSWAPDLSQFPGPKYLGLSRALRDAIRAGDLPANSQLPTVRDLAWRLHLTPGTVARAYQLATQEGLLAATVGRGTFVAAQSPRLGPTQALYTERITGGSTGPDRPAPAPGARGWPGRGVPRGPAGHGGGDGAGVARLHQPAGRSRLAGRDRRLDGRPHPWPHRPRGCGADPWRAERASA